MGAPAISTRAPARKPRPKPRTTARPKPRPAAKARPATSRPATKPRSRAATRTRARSAPARGPRLLTPVAAVGRTAVAVGGIADSGFVVGMTRTRVWIGVLCLLLGGIVAINVWGLGMSAAGSATAAKIDELQRESSVLRGRIATTSSNDRIAAAAGELGLHVPPPDGVNYIDAGSNNAKRAAERLANGKIEVAPPPAPAAEEEEAVAEEVAVDPAAVAPVEPTAPIDPTTGLPVESAVATTPIDPTTGLPVTP